jgi:hypothetical protein
MSVLGLPAPVKAQGAPTVTLKASDTHINFGESTRLHGRITPESGDEEINIVDENVRTIATTTTDNQGRYSVEISPKENVTVRAMWNELPSDDVALKVRPLIEVKMAPVRLFGLVKVRGRIQPGGVDKPVRLTLRRWGNFYESKKLNPKAGGWFKTSFRVDKPGGFRVEASYNGNDYLPAGDKSLRRETPLPNLSSGSNSIFVKLLEQRLRRLNYRVPEPNFSFDHRTSDGLIAFNKVQGRSRVGYVTDSTWRALSNPKIPKPRFNSPKYHIEVDQTKQVLYRVLKGKVITIMHVSTGAGAATRDGTFKVWSKLAGYSSKRLYYPSFFDGARGIHGWPSVPTYNASHGCVRIPMWTAVWMFGKSEIGTTVRIYH